MLKREQMFSYSGAMNSGIFAGIKLTNLLIKKLAL